MMESIGAIQELNKINVCNSTTTKCDFKDCQKFAFKDYQKFALKQKFLWINFPGWASS